MGLAKLNPCQLCGVSAASLSLNLGPQALSNRFTYDSPHPRRPEAHFPLGIFRCDVCGLVQLSQPAPAAELAPRFSWISYNEPEGHLDELAATISRLPGLAEDSRILGLSYKDDSLLQRLGVLGFGRTRRLDPSADLGLERPGMGVEMIQNALTPDRAAGLSSGGGRAAVIIARHFIEHAHDLPGLLAALRAMLAPGGYLVIEVSDCAVAFKTWDYTTIWEERILYFAPVTFGRLFHKLGQQQVYYKAYPYRPEGLLVGIGREAEKGQMETEMKGKLPESLPEAPAGGFEAERAAFEAFVANLPEQRRRVAAMLEGQHPVAVLGAGHLACAFINYLELKDRIAFVVDDNPNKQGLLMPGSRLPIRGSKSLVEESVRLCLLSVNPEVEERVIEKNRAFVDHGGRFASIFSASKRFLLAPMEGSGA